jgi:hypothetical protein
VSYKLVNNILDHVSNENEIIKIRINESIPNTIYRNESGKNINNKYFLLQKITKWSSMKKRDKIFLKNSIRKILACKKI